MPANLNKFETYISLGINELRYFVIEVCTLLSNKDRISVQWNCTSIRIRKDNTKLVKYNINITRYRTTETPKQNHNKYVKVNILFTRGKHLNDSIILPRKEVWAHKTSSTPDTVPSREVSCHVSVWCVRNVDFASFYDVDICFWNCSDSVGFFAFVV